VKAYCDEFESLFAANHNEGSSLIHPSFRRIPPMNSSSPESIADPSSNLDLTQRTAAPNLAISFRAVGIGAIVDIAGSLVMTTVVGVTAISALLLRGVSAQAIVEQLPSSSALALFCAAGGVLMSVAGGYTAARLAGHSHLRHALLAGLLAVLLNLGVNALVDDSSPLWLTALATALIVPFATVGGWLAMPSTDY
jgi:hypothetical protein